MVFRPSRRTSSVLVATARDMFRSPRPCPSIASQRCQYATRPSPRPLIPRSFFSSWTSHSPLSQTLRNNNTNKSRQFSKTARYAESYRRFGQPFQGPAQSRFAKARHLLSSRLVIVIVGGGLAFYFFNIETVEATGRRRFNIISPETEASFGEQTYREILNEYRDRILPGNHPLTLTVKKVMERLIPHVKIEQMEWKVHVVKDDRVTNAFVLPSGKVFVFTGMLPIAKDEDGLAAVLGHEVAHLVAHHPAERMSSGYIVFAAVLAISSIFDISGQIPALLMNFLYSLPNSRTQEAEADRIGLMIMSESCYNPEAAVHMWERFHKLEKQAPPQFMSTHPSSYNRSQALREWLPDAERRFEGSGCDFAGRYVQGFNDTYSRTD